MPVVADRAKHGIHAPESATLGEERATSATFRTEAGATASLARLLIVFFATHLFLDAATLNELTKTTNCFLNRFFVSNGQLYHKSSFAADRIPSPQTVRATLKLGRCNTL